ncbi:MAG: PAS domain S-box protein [Euryarchaeota archaeon]|nr:PAS domain S-box protein [Euryarchaeota archaeon]
MSSRDTTANRDQSRRQLVVYERSDSPQDGLASRLDGTDGPTTIRAPSDPVDCVAALADSTADCLVCEYSTETTAAMEALYELLSVAAPQLPRVAYVDSVDQLSRAHELGFSAVHLRRETDDLPALDERVRAAIETAGREPSSDCRPLQLMAASVDEGGTVHRTTGHLDEPVEDKPALWELSWVPTDAAVEVAIEHAAADPGQPYPVDTPGDDEMRIIADPTPSPQTNGESPETNGASVPGSRRLTVIAAVDSDTAGSQPAADADRTIAYEIVDELYRTLTTTRGSVEDRIQALLRVGQSYLDIDTGIVATVDDETYEIEQITSDDAALGTVDPGDRFPLSDTFCERTLANGETHSVTGVTESDPVYGGRAVVSEFGVCRYLGTPIAVDDETTGTLCFVGTNTKQSGFSPQDRLLTEFLATLVSYELQQHADQQALASTRTELAELFDRVDDAFFALDADWTFSYVNDRAEALLDADASALLGQSFQEIIPERQDPEWYDQFAAAVETGSSASFVVESAALDGWFDVTVYPSDSGLSVYFRDITDQQQRTMELERYEQILETVSDGVYALDREGVFTYVNEGLADLTGYSRSELVGSHVSIFKSDSTVADAEAAVSEQIGRAKGGDDAGDISLDLEIETAEGRTVPCTDHIALLPFDDRFRGSVGTLRDVSAQKQREETLSGLLTVTRALMAAETTGDVADLVVEAVSDVLGYDRAVVHLADEESDHLRPEAATEVIHEEVDTFSTPVDGEGPIGSAFESGTASRFDPGDVAGAEYGDSAELMSVPLGPYGTLTVGARESNAFTESDCQLIQLLTANAEEALNRTQRRQTLRRYEMILESVQEMMCVVDSAGRIKLLTDPLASRLDADRSGLVGRQFSTILAASTDEPNGPLTDLFNDASTEDITFKDSMRVADDESVPVSVEASQLPPVEGQPEAVITIHDISDLISAKEAAAAERERFTYLFENLTDPVDEIRVDKPEIKGVNSAFRSQFGDPADVETTLSGEEPAVAPIALDDERIVDRESQQSLSEEFRSEVERELKLTTTEGTKYYLYRSVPYEVDDELGGFEIYTDITALKQREIQLQVLHRLLRHNLRNDLNVIEGFAEMLKSELDDEQHREFAARIHSNATQLTELSETAKTIESVAGHRSLSYEPIAIGNLVRSTVETCAQTYDDADIFLEDLPQISVSAGPHLETAVAELIENAIEHNDSEPPTVSISIAVGDETATVTVSDNGPGLPPEEWAVVTGDTEISQLEHGSGLGLWLVRWVTEGYGGELTYHDRETGSAISIELPLADDTVS